ncbi:MAG: hypothetical protein C4558_02445 [Dehalococcoidia bacterium]|nr:MAG: hypothetical protein C4558_02445 [Dehalococcoidia bacterium]
MSEGLLELTQDDFSAGEVRDVAPHLIDPRGLARIHNGILDDDGSVARRGGGVEKTASAFGTNGRLIWDGYLIPGRRTFVANTNDFGVLDSDDETMVNLGGAGLTYPKPAVEFEGLLFIGGGTIYGGSRKAADYTGTNNVSVTQDDATVTKASGGFTANVDAGMLMQIDGAGRYYVVDTVTSDTELELSEPYEGSTDATATAVFSRLGTTAAAPYVTSDNYAVCQNRLVAISGKTVKFSDVLNPHSFPVDNDYEFPEGVDPLGFGPLGETLFVFTTGGAWAISGLALELVDPEGNPQTRQDLFDRNLILWGQTGIADFRGSLVVPAQDAVYLVSQNAAPQPVLHQIKTAYRDYVSAGYRPGQAAIFNEHYLLPILNTDATPGVADVLIGRFDRPIEYRGMTSMPWAHAVEAGAKSVALAVRTSNTNPRLLAAADDGNVIDATTYFDPAADYKVEADGTEHKLEIITRDFVVADGVFARIRKVQVLYELIAAEGDSPVLYGWYSSGAESTGQAQWDQAQWDVAQWAVEDETAWTSMSGPDGTGAPPDKGINPYTFFVNRRLRQIRFRFRSSGPAAKLIIRRLRLHVAPTGQRRK